MNPGLYVHVPFCQSKCPYCDFYSITSPDLISAYLSALEKEAQIYSTKIAVKWWHRRLAWAGAG